jgi:hypothetical protein
MRQFAYLEHVLDSVRDLCEAGAQISLHITTNNCPPSLNTGPCALRGQSSQETLLDNYRLIKELWAFTDNRIAVRFANECHDDSGNWQRSYGNEIWEFNEQGFMMRRYAIVSVIYP